MDAVAVVGIGASAGGLEALDEFLSNLPAQTGLAYVIVQHLDPKPTGMLPTLLQRNSPIPVQEITDGLVVRPDHVYVIPPSVDVSLVADTLRLTPPQEARGLRLPIDGFLRSLATELGERAIGVVLSGMGSDGTEGLRAIHARGGATFVQAPSTAKFSSMPTSAIVAGVADVEADAADLPRRILAYRDHAHRERVVATEHETLEIGVPKILRALGAATGQDFSHYKPSTLHRRIQRRMNVHQMTEVESYTRFVRDNAREAELLFKEMLIGVTSFFRDPSVWNALREVALPALLAARPGNVALRAWVPGCSTGEEAYTLAIVFKEVVDRLGPSRRVTLQIFATDLDHDAVVRARRGVYSSAITEHVSPERLRRFFVEEDHEFRVRREIRDMVVFADQNVLQEPPFTRLDLVSCRNLLIYLNLEPQRRLIPLFHYCLRPSGVMVLGTAETIGEFSDLFVPVDRTSRIYRRIESIRSTGATGTAPRPAPFRGRPHEALASDHAAPVAGPTLQTLAERFLLQRLSPAAVLTTRAGDVVTVTGEATRFLEVPAGKANWNILAMTRHDLRTTLSEMFHEAVRTDVVVRRPGIRLAGDHEPRHIELLVEPIHESSSLDGLMMVAFVPPPAPSAPAKRRRVTGAVSTAEHERDVARDELRTTREEMQTAQEELQSINEELQSTNEELQSTNEELTTSKEEMQSMNEELQTLNHELQAKVDDLSRTTNDMNNLLNSTEIAVLFLDNELKVRRFTPKMSKIIKLIPGDVGRPLADLATTLTYPEIYDDTRDVLATLVFKERAVEGSDGRWFSVRVMPYRTADNRIDGAVITFTNVTALKKLGLRLDQVLDGPR